MANDLFSRNEVDHIIAKRTVAERVRWFEEQGQRNNWNVNSQNWPIANQGYWHPSQPPQQQAQPNYSWQPQGFPNKDCEPSLRDVMAQIAQEQFNSTMLLNQLTEQLRKTNEAMATNLKEVEREHEEFPSNMINPEFEHIHAVTLRSRTKLQEQVERVPEPFTSARKVFNERSYEHDTETEKITSARNHEHERSYECDNLGFDTETFTSARKAGHERSCEVIKVWFEAEVVYTSSPSVATVTDVFDEDPQLGALFAEEENDDGRVIEFVKLVDERPVIEEVKPLLENPHSIAALVDDFDEDPHLSALFAEEQKDEDDEAVLDNQKLVREGNKPSMEELKPGKRKPVSEHVYYDYLNSTDTPSVLIYAGLTGLKEDEPHVEKKRRTGIGTKKEGESHVAKKHKIGIGVPKKEKPRFKKNKTGIGTKKEEYILDELKLYVPPQHRFRDMKKEITRKEIIK